MRSNWSAHACIYTLRTITGSLGEGGNYAYSTAWVVLSWGLMWMNNSIVFMLYRLMGLGLICIYGGPLLTFAICYQYLCPRDVLVRGSQFQREPSYSSALIAVINH